MLKLNNWFIGLVVMSTVVALIFGATYAFAQTNLAQSWGFGRRGGHQEEHQRPEGGDFENSDRGDRPAGDFGRERGREGHGSSLARGVGITVINLVKIALMIVVVSLVMPRLGTSLRQRYRAKQPEQAP